MNAKEFKQNTELVDKMVEQYQERLRTLVENFQAELNPSYIHTREELVIKLERMLIRAKMFR